MKHSFLDKTLKLIINQNWALKHNEIRFNHLGHPPEDLEEEVVQNMSCGFVPAHKIDSLLVLAGIIDISSIGFSV